MLGEQLLAHAALALDQDRGAGGRHHLDRLEHLLEERRAGEDVGGEVALDLEAQPPVLPLEQGLLSRLLHPHPELLEVRGLGEVVEGAQPHRLDGGLHVGEPGHDDRLQLGVLLADPGEDVDPVRVGKLEVEQEHVPLLRVEGLLGGLPRRAHLDVVVEVLEGAGHGEAEGGLVLGHENAEAGRVHALPEAVRRTTRNALPPFRGR